jgi:hypothetical protein
MSPSATGPVYTAGMQIETYVPSVMDTDPQGALGCFALDSGGKPVLLTCSHVLFPGFHAFPGLAVYQPNYSSCCSGGDRIATPVFDATQIEDGKYKGGFKTALGTVQVPAPNSAGYTTLNNQTCSVTDCAIASLDQNPTARFRNVWTTPGGEIAIGDVNTDFLSIPFTAAGTAPQPQSYVRVFSPMRNTLIYGTLAWFPTDTGDPDGMQINGKWLSPLFKFGITDSPQADEAAGSLPSLNQFLIMPRPAPIPGQTDYTKFYTQQPTAVLSFASGDSGSVVIDYQGKIIGQIVRQKSIPVSQMGLTPAQQSLVEFTAMGNFGVASPIQGVLDQLKITIPPSFDQAGPSSGAALEVFQVNPERAAEQRTVSRVRKALLESRRGRLLVGKIGQHRREIRTLLAKVRAVSIAWRALQGPAWYHQAVRNARNPSHRIPTAINGVTREQLVTTLTVLLMRHGSPELGRDIARHASWATPLLYQTSTLDDVPRLLARRRTVTV